MVLGLKWLVLACNAPAAEVLCARTERARCGCVMLGMHAAWQVGRKEVCSGRGLCAPGVHTHTHTLEGQRWRAMNSGQH